MTTCTYCHGARLVGWSGAGPILCPECSRGQDAFAVITQAWREQRIKAQALAERLAIMERERDEARRTISRLATVLGCEPDDEIVEATRLAMARCVRAERDLAAARELLREAMNHSLGNPAYREGIESDLDWRARVAALLGRE